MRLVAFGTRLIPESDSIGVQKPILVKVRFLISFVKESTFPLTDPVRVPIAGL